MDEEKTTLQKIVEQKTEQIKNAILQAVADGAKTMQTAAGVFVDGVFFVANASIDSKELTLCMRFRSDEFEEVIKPTSMLDEEANELRLRLKLIEEMKERRERRMKK